MDVTQHFTGESNLADVWEMQPRQENVLTDSHKSAIFRGVHATDFEAW